MVGGKGNRPSVSSAVGADFGWLRESVTRTVVPSVSPLGNLMSIRPSIRTSSRSGSIRIVREPKCSLTIRSSISYRRESRLYQGRVLDAVGLRRNDGRAPPPLLSRHAISGAARDHGNCRSAYIFGRLSLPFQRRNRQIRGNVALARRRPREVFFHISVEFVVDCGGDADLFLASPFFVAGGFQHRRTQDDAVPMSADP